jgi:hypothetical protein
LARRAEAHEALREARHRENKELERARQSRVKAKKILHWLASEGIVGSYREQVVDEARFKLRLAEQTGGLPPLDAVLADLTVDQIIEAYKPQQIANEDVCFVEGYGAWLAQWAFFAMPDPWVRFSAIETALSNASSTLALPIL